MQRHVKAGGSLGCLIDSLSASRSRSWSLADRTCYLAVILHAVNLLVESAMSLPLSKGAKGATQAEIVLQPQLKSCLVNLPSSLVSVLVNANTVTIFCRMRKKSD